MHHATHTEGASGLIRSRRKRVEVFDGTTRAETSPPVNGNFCVVPGYDDEEKRGTETHQVSFDWMAHLLDTCFVYVTSALLRASQIVRGSKLSYREARPARRGATCVAIVTTIYVVRSTFVALLIHPLSESLRPVTDESLENIPVLIERFDFSAVEDIGGWIRPPFPTFHTLEAIPNKDKDPDYGGITFKSLATVSKESFHRGIDPSDEFLYERERETQLKGIDSPSDSTYNFHPEEIEFDEMQCQRPSWKDDYYPNCNTFHEFELGRSAGKRFLSGMANDEYDSNYFSHGTYREAWLVETLAEESWIVKMIRYKRNFGGKENDIVQKDAVVMEKLSSSPRIVDMYGHCATSLTVEAMDNGLESYMVPGDGYMDQEELDSFDDVMPQNELNKTEKIQLALEMAESIAELHGYEGGVIAHDDIQPSQWLRSKAGRLKLGDFNRAQILDWNEEKQEYCPFFKGGDANYRAPEEYARKACDEQIDVFSMANNIYALITGLWVYYDNRDWDVVQKKIIDGELPFVDDRYRKRSYAEKALIEIMEQGWSHDPSKRIDIFRMVKLLRQALGEHLRLENQKPAEK